MMVNPYAVKQTKELDDNSQSKNDRKDPMVIAKLVTEGRYSVPYKRVNNRKTKITMGGISNARVKNARK